MNKFQKLNSTQLTDDHCFISLDAVKLYPSIPIEYGISAFMEFSDAHWNKIYNFGANIEDLRKALQFISYNYEIEFNGSVYLQMKGCPMGSHFAPPFAVIFLHKIETQALQVIAETYDLVPEIYARYIDDIILGPLNRNSPLNSQILQAFNSINSDMKFTLEVPEIGKPLNFLDMSIYVDRTGISYTDVPGIPKIVIR